MTVRQPRCPRTSCWPASRCVGSADEHSDLFWALRGAAGGRLDVVRLFGSTAPSARCCSTSPTTRGRRRRAGEAGACPSCAPNESAFVYAGRSRSPKTAQAAARERHRHRQHAATADPDEGRAGLAGPCATRRHDRRRAADALFDQLRWLDPYFPAGCGTWRPSTSTSCRRRGRRPVSWGEPPSSTLSRRHRRDLRVEPEAANNDHAPGDPRHRFHLGRPTRTSATSSGPAYWDVPPRAARPTSTSRSSSGRGGDGEHNCNANHGRLAAIGGEVRAGQLVQPSPSAAALVAISVAIRVDVWRRLVVQPAGRRNAVRAGVNVRGRRFSPGGRGGRSGNFH